MLVIKTLITVCFERVMNTEKPANVILKWLNNIKCNLGSETGGNDLHFWCKDNQ